MMSRSEVCTIIGQPPSKSNSYRIVTVAGHGTLAKTKALRAYEDSFFMQCNLRNKDITARFRLVIDVYYASDRPDLDNALKVVLDCLQTCRAIRNDRQCSEIVARKLIDKKQPRVEFRLDIEGSL